MVNLEDLEIQPQPGEELVPVATCGRPVCIQTMGREGTAPGG